MVLNNQSTSSSSNYKRLLRIFEFYALTRLWLDILLFVFHLVGLKGDYLLLDGTSWKRGKKTYHYLTLALVYEGVAVPIYWINLYKLGASHTQERIMVIKKALKYFNLKDKTLLADREYEGVEWFKYLISHNLDFVIRLKKGHYAEAITGTKGKTYEELINKVKRSKLPHKAVKKTFCMNGMRLVFVVCKNPKVDAKEPYLLFISTLDKHAKYIADTYLIRWKIEHCFKHLKSNGFQLEDINLKHESRCRLLMAITVMAYVLSVEEGLRKYKQVQVKYYQDGSEQKQESVFRTGLDQMMKVVGRIELFVQYLVKKIKKRKQKKNIIINQNVQ